MMASPQRAPSRIRYEVLQCSKAGNASSFCFNKNSRIKSPSQANGVKVTHVKQMAADVPKILKSGCLLKPGTRTELMSEYQHGRAHAPAHSVAHFVTGTGSSKPV
eukprot:2075171-Rhodomonas_salina.1